MALREMILQVFDQEMRGTRIVLERVPGDKPEFKPHDKSMPMGRLAVHIARLPNLAATILRTPSLDLAGAQWPALVFESRERLLADFDGAAAEARALLAAADDASLGQEWSMSFGDKPIGRGPRAVMYQTIFLNHLLHHRAQLGVYLRLNDLPVPALYGPSADDRLGF
jgi:uncharacterized damage-inducible protein DinB